MDYRVTVRNEYGVKVAEATARTQDEAQALVRVQGLPKHWFIVVETVEGTPLGDRLMYLKPVAG